MTTCKRIALLAFTLLFHFFSKAQNSVSQVSPEKVNVMRSAGKIYVVVAIVVTILAGLIFYVARLDRKITRLEKGNV